MRHVSADARPGQELPFWRRVVTALSLVSPAALFRNVDFKRRLQAQLPGRVKNAASVRLTGSSSKTRPQRQHPLQEHGETCSDAGCMRSPLKASLGKATDDRLPPLHACISSTSICHSSESSPTPTTLFPPVESRHFAPSCCSYFGRRTLKIVETQVRLPRNIRLTDP